MPNRNVETLCTFTKCLKSYLLSPARRNIAQGSAACRWTPCATQQRHLSHSAGYSYPPRVLITGGLGQLGVDLTRTLRKRYGVDNVVSSDIQKPKNCREKGPFLYLDVLKVDAIREAIVNYEIDWIIHFSAILSAVGEQNVPLAMRINIESLHNVLQVARQFNLRLFVPSTIGAFGPTSPKLMTPDVAIQQPKTVYGVSKVYCELLGEYFHHKFGVDFRCIRFPGIISAETKPGGGTTDYAVQIFHDALQTGKHECYLREDTVLPMMYIDDCLDSITLLMEARATNLKRRVYNISAMSFSPPEIADVISTRIKNFSISYNVCEARQAIADSWPASLDDSNAKKDWSWAPKHDLAMTVDTMLNILKRDKPMSHAWWETDQPIDKIELDGKNLFKVDKVDKAD